MDLRPKKRLSAEYNMSSMTDIVFLLLIFFIIISSVAKDPSLKVILPKGTKTPVVNKVVRVYVDANLNYAVDERKTTYDRLPFTLKSVLKNNPSATVSIHGDKSVKYENVMDLVMMADKLEAKVVLALDASK